MVRRHIKKFFPIGLTILLVACDPIIELGAAPTLTPTLAPTVTPAPTLTPLPTAISTPAPTFTPTVIPTPSPTISPTAEVVTLIPIMPQAAMADAPNPPPFGQDLVAYEIPTSLEDIRDFYQENLTFQGWNWGYTEIGESLILGRPTNILVQEFRRGQIRLAIIAIDGYVFSIPPPGAVVIAATNFTGEQLMTLFTGGTLDVVYNMAGGAQEVVNPSAMQFSSPLLQFNHPSDWFPTQSPSFSLRTDTEDGAINIFEDPTRCATNEVICFINFTLLGGSGFSSSPVALRIYSDQAGSTLESFDIERWTAYIEMAERQPASSRNVSRFEDLIAPGSLELIELNSLTLKGGTPALQRIYRWRQIGLSTPLVSSYTLFKHNDDTIIEFRTDFTKEEWDTLSPAVQEAILSIEIVP